MYKLGNKENSLTSGMPHAERVAKGMESSLQFGLVCRNSSTLEDAKSRDRINQQIFKQPNNKNIAKNLLIL